MDAVTIEIDLLGSFDVRVDGARAPIPASRKTRALLAFLSVSERPVSRSKLCQLFWELPDDPRGALRWSLSRLRKAFLPYDVMAADRERVSLKKAAIHVDCLDLYRGVPQDAPQQVLEEAAALGRGAFLADLYLPDCPEFEAWRAGTAVAIEVARVDVLRRLIERTSDRPPDALRYARELKTLRPYDGDVDRTIDALSSRDVVISLDGPVVAGAPPKASLRRSAPPQLRQVTVLEAEFLGAMHLIDGPDFLGADFEISPTRQALVAAIERYGGNVVALRHDGLVASFGWPVATEDAADRAVRAALSAIDDTRAHMFGGASVITMALATGVALVAEPREGAPATLAGPTPSRAKSLLAHAPPGDVSCDGATRALVRCGAGFEPLGLPTKNGVIENIDAFMVLPPPTAYPPAAQTPTGHTPPSPIPAHSISDAAMLGRDAELSLLIDRWEAAQSGEGQVVVLTGDAGIGKSRLVRALIGSVARSGGSVMTLQCSAHHERSPFYPILRQVERAAGVHPSDEPSGALQKLSDAFAAQSPFERTALSDAFNITGHITDLDPHAADLLSPTQQRHVLRRLIVERITRQSRKAPHLIVCEDAHWIDPSSEDILSLVAGEASKLPLMLLVTHRGHPQAAYAQSAAATTMRLSRLKKADADALAARTLGEGVDADARAIVVERAGGNPLHIEELGKAVRDLGVGAGVVPPSLQFSFLARLDAMDEEREVAEVCSLIARPVTSAILQRVLSRTADTVERDLETLVDRQVMLRVLSGDGTAFEIRHALLMDVVRASIIKPRKRALHRQIADALEEVVPHIRQSEPETLAFHLEEAGLSGEAIPLWLSAGDRAAMADAAPEARAHFEEALQGLLAVQSLKERETYEMAARLGLATALTKEEGYQGAVGEHFARAAELSRRHGDRIHQVRTLFGLWRFSSWTGDGPQRRVLAAELSTVSQDLSPTAGGVLGHYAMAITAFAGGELIAARDNLLATIHIYETGAGANQLPRLGQDPHITARAVLPIAEWLCGNLEASAAGLATAARKAEAMAASEAALTVGLFTAIRHHMDNAPAAAGPSVDRALDLAKQQSYCAWLPHCQMVKGWQLVSTGKVAQGLALMEENAAWCLKTASLWTLPYHLERLGKARLAAGDPNMAVAGLEEAIALTHRTEEHWWRAELHRTLAAAQSAAGATADVVSASLREAVKVAACQGARSLELRALKDQALHYRKNGELERAASIDVDMEARFAGSLP